MLVDTNILIALMVDGRESQRTVALARLTELGADNGLALICESVLVEACWVLESVYRLRRREIALAMRALVATPPLRTWDQGLSDAALATMARRPALSVTDCLLLRRVVDSGSAVMSFDSGLLRELRRNA